jgi:1,4-dihydroxy-2-naphthoate octaprenyltransferase
LAWGPTVFVDHVFGNLASAPDPDRVTIWAMLARAGLPSGRAVSVVLAVVGGAAALGLAWAGRRSLSTSLMACGLGLFAFTLGATFAGYNYYVYGLVFITWGLLIPATPSRLVKSD